MTGPTDRQIADARFQALTVLALIALLAVVTGLFGNLETHLLTGALGVVGGLRAATVLRHPERHIRGPDLDGFIAKVAEAGGLVPEPGESERSIRVRLLDAMEWVQERVEDAQERRHHAWLVGGSALVMPFGFWIPFLRTVTLAFLVLIVVYVAVHRADRLPRRRRAAEALEMLERQLAELDRPAAAVPRPDRPELTSGA